MLRLWLLGHGKRGIARLAGVDRKTVGRYVSAAQAAGCDRHGGVGQLCDELVAVIGGARPARAAGHGSTWDLLEEHRSIRDQGSPSSWIHRDHQDAWQHEVALLPSGLLPPFPGLATRLSSPSVVEHMFLSEARSTVRTMKGGIEDERSVRAGRHQGHHRRGWLVVRVGAPCPRVERV